MTDGEFLKSLSLTSADWKRLPHGYMRRRLLPLMAFSAMVLALSFTNFWQAHDDKDAAAFTKGIQALWLLLIPAALGCRVYFETVIDLKIMKASDLQAKPPVAD